MVIVQWYHRNTCRLPANFLRTSLQLFGVPGERANFIVLAARNLEKQETAMWAEDHC